MGVKNHLLSLSQPLTFISDEILKGLSSNLLNKAQSAADRDEEEMHKNVLDPFSATFDAVRQGITLDQWLEQEKSRQAQKTLQNFIGEFHQNVLGTVPGWENMSIGGSIDIRNIEKKVIAEIKNKHNTMNSSSALAIYDKLSRHLDYNDIYHGYTSYCVGIIPKTPASLDIPFHPSERGTHRPRRENIRIIDGKSFYKLATGDPDALDKLYVRLVLILSEIKGTDPDIFVGAGTFEDLFKRAYSSVRV